MTLLLSLIHRDGIVMAADSRKTTPYTPRNIETLEPIGETQVAYDRTAKLFHLNGIGVVTMWGDITHTENTINRYMESIYSLLKGPDDLADNLFTFLKETVHENSDDDVGFHVGGFRSDDSKALFHVFYGRDRGPHVDQSNNPQIFHKYDHSDFLALYNGNNAIAHTFITHLDHMQQGGFLTKLTQEPLTNATHFAASLLKNASAYDPAIGGDISVATITAGNIIAITSYPELRFPEPTLSQTADFSILPSGISMVDFKTLPSGSMP